MAPGNHRSWMNVEVAQVRPCHLYCNDLNQVMCQAFSLQVQMPGS